jgi:UDP-N-acetyl-D-mannosaminuronate dehydrogenase
MKIAVVGLGYVGLPLARLFATKYPVVGFDINQSRVDELNSGVDSTLEVEQSLLESVLLKILKVVKLDYFVQQILMISRSATIILLRFQHQLIKTIVQI